MLAGATVAVISQRYPRQLYHPHYPQYLRGAEYLGGGGLLGFFLLILLRIIRLNGLGLDDDSRVASGEGAAFGGDGAGDIARGESQCHRDGGGDGYNEVLNGLPQALFLNFC